MEAAPREVPSISSFEDVTNHRPQGQQSTSGPDDHQEASERSWNDDASSSESRTVLTGTNVQTSSDTLSPLPRRTSRTFTTGQRRTGSTDSSMTQTESERSGTPNTFELPLRSLFASGQPTSSISANTAQASISSTNTVNVARPFAALSGAATTRRSLGRPVDLISPSGATSSMDYSIPGLEKDVDDPASSTLYYPGNTSSTTSQALTNLFVPSDDRAPASLSRRTTQGRSFSGSQRKSNDVSTIEGHLYNTGFREGRHSDIAIHAFGQQYKLHKLLLDRVPFFSSAFCGSWAESSAAEMTLMPEDIDSNITKAGFELALRRIYGTIVAADEEGEAIGLFATACWLDMPDLIDTCIENILRQMRPENLHTLINLATNSYYGKPGDRVLSSAKAMLCRVGGEMPYEHWDDIPADIIKEVIASDPFYIQDEWERWHLALRILNRRLRRLSINEDLAALDGRYLCPKPRCLSHKAIRSPLGLRRDENVGSTKTENWRRLYGHPEIVPLLQLLDTGIHYVHLRFEELQHMRCQRDILGTPVLPEKVISDALWMSMELRQKILNAQESDVELGLSEYAAARDSHYQTSPSSFPQTVSMGKQPEMPDDDDDEDDDTEPHNVSDQGLRKYWIPSTDVSCVLGGSSEAFAASSLVGSSNFARRSRQLSASFEPTDVTWPPDLGGTIFDSHANLSRTNYASGPPAFTRYPPFRFCAEFPNPRTLKEKKRVYSRTVWYAGSMWNLYIQRINTPKNQQLGIYLHRAKDKDNSEDPLALTVDDRIGQLERDMLLRRNEQRLRPYQADTSTHHTDPEQEERVQHEQHDAAIQDNPSGLDRISSTPGALRPSNSSQISTPTRPTIHHRATTSNAANGTALRPGRSESSVSTIVAEPTHLPPSDDPLANNYDIQSEPSHSLPSPTVYPHKITTPTIPPYTDMRSTIKTYFKIYSPSKGGRLLSVYESAPDSFNFGKSWGWKSSQMVLDDGIGAGSSSGAGNAGGDNGRLSSGFSKDSGRDSKLRYMVVIGNV